MMVCNCGYKFGENQDCERCQHVREICDLKAINADLLAENIRLKGRLAALEPEQVETLPGEEK